MSRYAALILLIIAAAVPGCDQVGTILVVFEQGVEGFEGFEDTTIYEESDNAGGGYDGIFSGAIRTGFLRRGLIRVDLSSLPAGTVVRGVDLEMTVDMTGGNFGDIEYGLYSVSKEWGEGDAFQEGDTGGQGTEAADGDATWTSNHHNVEMWDMAGGDFAENPSALALAGQVDDLVIWGSQDMVDDVQAWIDNPQANFGWIIVSSIEATSQRVKRFYSSESAISPPRLTLRVEEQ